MPNAVRSYTHGIVSKAQTPLSKKNIVFAKKRGSATCFLAIPPLIPPKPFHACILYIIKKKKNNNNFKIGSGGDP